jgi:hypothetical protein
MASHEDFAMNRLPSALVVFALAGFASACTTLAPTVVDRGAGSASHAVAATSSKRVIYYYQTQYSNNVYVSLEPIWKTRNPKTGLPYTTDVLIAAFHLGYDSNNQPYIHLNDNPPSDPMFDVMWPQVRELRRHGITRRMMLGGAAQGSYAVLFAHWQTFYPILTHTLRYYKLDGIDLDVEENVSLADIEMLIGQLHADMGPGFEITLAPVASALWGGANLSGFNYQQLYQSPEGADIAWFDAQFYSGFGSLRTTSDYDRVIAAGYPPDIVVAGMIANRRDGFGFVPIIPTITATVSQLVSSYPTFGGVFAWEYFNAEPGGPSKPARWSLVMGNAMGL